MIRADQHVKGGGLADHRLSRSLCDNPNIVNKALSVVEYKPVEALPNVNGNRKATQMETVLLTYEELAARLGVQPESARKTTQRRRWRRMKGNDRHVRVYVPLDELPPPEPEPVMPGPTPEQITAALREDKARLEAETGLLREMLARSDLTAEEQKGEIERWHSEALKWQEEAESWRLQASVHANGAKHGLDVFAFMRRRKRSTD
jgi:hypothetical protein